MNKADSDDTSVPLARNYTYALAKSAATNIALSIMMDRLLRRYVEPLNPSSPNVVPGVDYSTQTPNKLDLG